MFSLHSLVRLSSVLTLSAAVLLFLLLSSFLLSLFHSLLSFLLRLVFSDLLVSYVLLSRSSYFLLAAACAHHQWLRRDDRRTLTEVANADAWTPETVSVCEFLESKVRPNLCAVSQSIDTHPPSPSERRELNNFVLLFYSCLCALVLYPLLLSLFSLSAALTACLSVPLLLLLFLIVRATRDPAQRDHLYIVDADIETVKRMVHVAESAALPAAVLYVLPIVWDTLLYTLSVLDYVFSYILGDNRVYLLVIFLLCSLVLHACLPFVSSSTSPLAASFRSLDDDVRTVFTVPVAVIVALWLLWVPLCAIGPLITFMLGFALCLYLFMYHRGERGAHLFRNKDEYDTKLTKYLSDIGVLPKMQVVPSPSPTPGTAVPTPDNNGTCIVCADAKADCLLMDCRHLQTCSACAGLLTRCPVCRAPILDKIKVYN